MNPLDSDFPSEKKNIEFSQEGIQVTIDLTYEEFKNYFKMSTLKLPTSSSMKFVIPFISVLVLLILPALIYKYQPGKNTLIAPAVFAIVFIGFFLLRYSGIGNKSAYKNYAKGLPAHFVVHEKGINIKTTNSISASNWNIFTKAEIKPDATRLFISKRQFFVFPKKYFKEGDYDAFCKLVIKNVKVGMPYI